MAATLPAFDGTQHQDIRQLADVDGEQCDDKETRIKDAASRRDLLSRRCLAVPFVSELSIRSPPFFGLFSE